MAFELPALPYPEAAPWPTIRPRPLAFTINTTAYVDNLNKLIAGTDLEGKSLEEIIMAVAKDPARIGVFNNAAQVWNHTFFWNCMSPHGGGRPAGMLAHLIDEAFGGYEKFAEQFKAAAVGRFGSGWGWLVLDNDALKIVSTPNAENPMTQNQVPLLTVDVWEHAYCLDYQNRCPISSSLLTTWSTGISSPPTWLRVH